MNPDNLLALRYFLKRISRDEGRNWYRFKSGSDRMVADEGYTSEIRVNLLGRRLRMAMCKGEGGSVEAPERVVSLTLRHVDTLINVSLI